MKYVILALCIYISQAAPASEADVLASLKDKKISTEAQMLSGEQLLKYLKTNQNLFEAEVTPHSQNMVHKLMDFKYIDQNRMPVAGDADDDEDDDIPESFDARLHWSNCPSLRHIRDQANCGSCWAVSSASAFSDRVCIATGGEKQVYVSATDILSCCHLCGEGCNGGYPIEAFYYLTYRGAVTGGDYGATDCCRPYPFHPCGHHGNETYYGECPEDGSTPECVRKCQEGYETEYHEDRVRGEDAYRLPIGSVKAIQKEIMRNGPVVAAFIVFDDFSFYRKGIYAHVAGSPRGGHAVKIIGWGTEHGVPYWIIANSWHSDWGEDGYFRMVRGINDCGIETNVVAGKFKP
nr:Peptidase C1A domain containing protein [Haemonchus contortus]